MKKIIIIGSSGFIGKSIKEYIRRNKINISKVFTYSRSERKNIINMQRLPKVDYIIYCINSKKINQSIKYFNHFKNLLNGYSKKTKILFLSSGAVYGKNTTNKKSRETSKINLKSVNRLSGYKKNYAKEKIYLEKKFMELSNHGYKVSIARCFTFVGKYIPKNSHFLIGNLIKNILDRKKLSIKSNYKIIRSFMHTDDLSRCLFKIMNKTKDICKIYNVGSDDAIEINVLLRKLSNKYKIRSNKMNNLNIKKTDYYVPNTNKIKNELNWRIKHKSFDAIVKTLNDLNSLK